MSDTLRTRTDGEFDDVVAETIGALEDEGFGVLCDIDVRETLQQKLDEDFRRYRILGACNPGLAHRGLEDDLDLGTVLPCNVVVYDDDGGVVVSAVDPRRLIGVTENDDLDPIGDDAYERFERVLESL
ncbi:DUF302 domain-containing protein [Natrinema thermotolerans]|uniref:DUF302 domain-containing protein n=1 Tax=Natrinema thermotolerans TaxID=121872 RepID=A0AAF0PDJ0_9EURY|nr:DUF302 domain-containing protein [Natrinema thermotolerans]ELZ10268.1 hypothetical protein C478_15287 [Natrinema thermotolerans DSM 11552]QCC60134.1 DUF302 domain-containing protein [Natrinema thermotolerans]QCC61047.1 DUF302 domain-containing protein [Natrinema thermotolerans]WMT07145.1 DUF302 domain-containing protein [Natrinema thermotolerans]